MALAVDSPPAPRQGPTRHGAARAALFSGAAEITARVLALLLSVVTARLLEPYAVGLLGLAVIITGLVSMVGYYFADAGVVARGQADDTGYATASVVLRAAVVLGLVLATWRGLPALADYLAGSDRGAHDLVPLLSLLLWVPIVEALGGYPQVWLQRSLDLGFLAGVQLAQPIAFVGLAIVLLARGDGPQGVAVAQLASTGLAAVLVWLRLGSRRGASWPGPPPRPAWGQLLRGSAALFVGGFGGYLGERLDNLLVAGTIGHTRMSFYSMAWNATRAPTSIFARAIRNVLVPTLPWLRDDPPRLERALRECVRLSYVVLAPGLALLCLEASTLTVLVLGPKWLPVVPPLRIMCASALGAPLLFTAGALLVGTGRAHLLGISMLVHLVLQVALIPPVVRRFGLTGAAWADAAIIAASTAALVATALAVERHVRWVPLVAILRTTAAAVFAGATAWALGWTIDRAAEPGLAAALLALITYPLFLVLLGEGSGLKDLLVLVREALRGRRTRELAGC